MAGEQTPDLIDSKDMVSRTQDQEFPYRVQTIHPFFSVQTFLPHMFDGQIVVDEDCIVAVDLSETCRLFSLTGQNFQRTRLTRLSTY